MPWTGIGGNRVQSAVELSTRVPQRSVFILDDAFQHRAIRRDLDIVCIHEGIFNDKMIPRGYLREPVASLERAHIVLLVTESQASQQNGIIETFSTRFPNLHIIPVVQKPLSGLMERPGNTRRGRRWMPRC